MAINFPASPSVNDTFTEGSITYKCLQNEPTKWIGLGLTPSDRLVEGSNNLEINSSNNLIWTGGSVGIGVSDPDSILETVSPATDGINAHIGGIYNDGGQSAVRRIEFGVKNYRNVIQSQQGSGGNNFSSDNDLLLNPSGGNVGIGSTSANANLHIASGSSTAVGDATNPALQVGGVSNYRFAVHTTSEAAIIANKNGDDGIAFHTKTANSGSFGEAVRIDTNGNVGVGSDNPSQPLTLKRSSSGQGTFGLRFEWEDTTAPASTSAAVLVGSDGLKFKNYNSGRDFIFETGAVQSSSGKIESLGNSAYVRTIESGGATVELQSGGSQGYIGTETDHHLSIRTNSTVVAEFSEAGDLHICHPTNSSSGQILGILQFASLNSDCFQNQEDCYRINFWENTRTTTQTRSDNSNASIRYNASTSDGGDGSIRFANESGTRLLFMNRLGNGGTSGAWNVGSDRRKKDNIATVTNALDKVNQLRGVDFNWKERYGGHADSGVIAQEVESVLPHLVITQDGARDKDDDGNVVNMKQMNYNGLWGVMIEAIKELTARVEELEK